MKGEMFLHPGKPPSRRGTPAGTEGELPRLRGERSSRWGRPERRDTGTGLPSRLAAPQPETCACWYMHGMGAKTQASEDRAGERTGVAFLVTA